MKIMGKKEVDLTTICRFLLAFFKVDAYGKWFNWKEEEQKVHSLKEEDKLFSSKGAKVGEVWETTGDGGGWNMRFIRPFNDWELEET